MAKDIAERKRKAAPAKDPAKDPAKKTADDAAPVRKKRLSPQERRADFIRKAALFFADEGFGGGTRDLARKLGVTQPLLYRYFPSKEDLIKEVYRAIYIDRWRPEWDSMLTDRSRPIRDRLQTFYESYTDTIFSREWLRIYLFAGLKGIELNRLYVGFVEDRILSRIIAEYRDEAGLPPQIEPAQPELELAWVLHGGIFYYGVRKVIFEAPVMEQKSRFIANALDVFLEGISRVFATGVKSRNTQARRTIAPTL